MHFTSFKEAEQQKRVEYKERLRTKKPRRAVRNLSNIIDVKREATQKKMSSKEKNKIQMPQISFPRKKETSVIEMTSTSIFRFESKEDRP